MRILVFGNSLVEQDSIALKILPKLKEVFPDIRFIEFEPTEDFRSEGRTLNIIDAAEPNFSEVRELILESEESFNQLENTKVLSMHDFDLGYNLKLFKKLGMIDKVNVICIPGNLAEQDAINQSQLILRKWVAHDMQGS